MKKRERIGIEVGDLIRCPDRATARWHRVVRVGRRKDGTRYVTLRRTKFWRALGLSAFHQIEWSDLRAIGYGLRKQRAPEEQDKVRAGMPETSRV